MTDSLATIGGTFAEILEIVRARTDAHLDEILTNRRAAARGRGPDVALIADAVHELTMRGGKRFRAALAVLGFGAVDADAPVDVAIDLGAALELFQTYLLIQDDWMDGDATRRGGASVHVALAAKLGGAHRGAASAILASDLAWGLALREVTSLDAPEERVLEVVRELARIHDDVIDGQQLDLCGRATDVDLVNELKTGSYTVRGPLALGAILGGASPATRAALDRYATPLGLAFQLRDDLLGTFGTEAETGKPVGNDLRAGKRTAIIVEAEARLSADEGDALRAVLGDRAASNEAVLRVTALLEARGARAAVEQRLASLADEAVRLADDASITRAVRPVLGGAARMLAVTRRS